MKKVIYIGAFTFLGILLQLLVHGIVEKWYIGLLVSNFETYGLGLSWADWFLIHHVGTFVLFIVGFVFGIWQGRYWFKRIYGKAQGR